MNKRKGMLVTTTMLLTLCCGIQPALAATGQPLPVTKEQQEALQRYRTQQEILQQHEQKIRAVTRAMKLESKQLRQLVKKDSALQKQVKTDLQGFHDKLKQAYQLHKTGEGLNKNIHAARMNKDLAKMRALTEQLVDTKKAQLALLESAHRDLQAELKKAQQ